MKNSYKGYRMLLVHAHPDDETINNGRTMAMYAALGAAVTLVTCPRGEEGEVQLLVPHRHRQLPRRKLDLPARPSLSLPRRGSLTVTPSPSLTVRDRTGRATPVAARGSARRARRRRHRR